MASMMSIAISIASGQAFSGMREVIDPKNNICEKRERKRNKNRFP